MKKGFERKFRQFASALERLDVEKQFLIAANELSELALDLNKVQMYELGIDAKGKSFGEYASSTRVAKQRKGQRSDHITLRDTGSYQDGMFLEAKQVPIFIDTEDGKKGILAKWNALGLYPPFEEQYKNEVGKLARKGIHREIEKAKNKILH